MVSAEPEISGLHAKGENNIQKCCTGKEDRDFAERSGCVNKCEDRVKEVVDEPACNAAESEPDSLAGELPYSCQGYKFPQK